jgi:hypothetical protein
MLGIALGIALLAGAALAAVAVIMVIVAAGIRREDRYRTFERPAAPGPSALLARTVLGRYVRTRRMVRRRGRGTPAAG